MINIGIIKEEKTPVDNRVPFTPNQIKEAEKLYPSINWFVQPSDIRCFSDQEYESIGATLTNDLSECDILFGVKEIPISSLLENKHYFFFSHTIKKQEYNKNLLKTILDKNIQLTDYECLTNEDGRRLVAFGRWAGIVGAYNGLRTWDRRNRNFDMPTCSSFHDYEELISKIQKNHHHGKIVVTGDGRVAQGAWELLDHAEIREVSADALIHQDFEELVYAKLKTPMLYSRKDNAPFELSDFFKNPSEYKSTFTPYLYHADVFINAVYWDPKAPVFFTWSDTRKSDFSLRTIADITCDIEGSVPTTLRATTIENPFMGIDPHTEKEVEPFDSLQNIDVMSVDNLPNELPRDASEEFGAALLEYVIPDLLLDNEIIDRATIARNGELTENFSYLAEWVNNL